MVLALDGSTPTFVKGTSNPATTASFSPPANAMLIAFAEADEGNTFSVSGGSLTWTQIDSLSGGGGVASVSSWRAFTTTAPGSITVSSTRTGGFTANSLKVLVFTGAETSFTGAHSIASSNTTSATATQTGSWFWAGLGQDSGSTSDAAGTGCSWNDAEAAFGGISGGILKRTTADATNGSSTTMSAGSSAAGMAIVMVEVKAASASTAVFPLRPRLMQPIFRAANY